MYIHIYIYILCSVYGLGFNMGSGLLYVVELKAKDSGFSKP